MSERRSNEPLLMGRGMNGIANRLVDQAAEMERLERHLAAARKRRDLLCLKLATGGASTRTIGAIAGLSSPGVTFACRRAREALAVSREAVAGRGVGDG